MLQTVVLQRNPRIRTVAHESMHVATFIYYLIKKHYNNPYLLSQLFNWTLYEASVVKDDTSYGYFKRRNWGSYTDEAASYCCLAGFIGGYIFTDFESPNTNNSSYEFKKHIIQNYDLINWLVNDEWSNSDDLKFHYKLYGANADLENSNVCCYSLCIKIINEIVDLLKHKCFVDLLTDCMELLIRKQTLCSVDLVNLAYKYKETILLDVINHSKICVSLGDNHPIYKYF